MKAFVHQGPGLQARRSGDRPGHHPKLAGRGRLAHSGRLYALRSNALEELP